MNIRSIVVILIVALVIVAGAIAMHGHGPAWLRDLGPAIHGRH
jgi:hypothetical protein